MKNKPVAYLAGAMEKAGEYGKIWRKEITPWLEELGYFAWNPYLEEHNVGISVPELTALKNIDFTAFCQWSGKIVDYDIDQLKHCSLAVCLLDKAALKGAGTISEITVCRLNNIPVYAWIVLPNGKLDVPAWTMGCITKYAEDKDSFYRLLPSAITLLGAEEKVHERHLEEYIENWSEYFSDL